MGIAHSFFVVYACRFTTRRPCWGLQNKADGADWKLTDDSTDSYHIRGIRYQKYCVHASKRIGFTALSKCNVIVKNEMAKNYNDVNFGNIWSSLVIFFHATIDLCFLSLLLNSFRF